MPLIASPRHRPEDVEAWALRERQDAVHAHLATHARRVEEARAALVDFAQHHACYAGVSWGKDSTALAHLVAIHAPTVPLVWVRTIDANPDCALVRDAFVSAHPLARYVEAEGRRSPNAATHGSERGGSLVDGLRRCGMHGRPYLSGVRGAESMARRLRVARWGTTTARTCAPLARWSGADVYAYLYAHGLPVHPAYACTMGGLLDRDRIRVGPLGGERTRGDGHGRREWEARYYGVRA